MEHSDLLVLLAIEKLAGFNLTQDQLGELCGLSRDTFTGTLVRLKKKGLIESSSGHIRCLKKTDLTISPECFNRVSPCFKLLSESCPLTERLGKDVLSKLCDETRYDGSMWKFDIFFNFAVDILSRLEIAPLNYAELAAFISAALYLEPLSSFYLLRHMEIAGILEKAKLAADRLQDPDLSALLDIAAEVHWMMYPAGYAHVEKFKRHSDYGFGMTGLSCRYISYASPFYGAYHYLVGHPQLALEHFDLHGDRAEFCIYRIFEALAHCHTGNHHMGRHVLQEMLDDIRMKRCCPEQRFLHALLAQVCLERNDIEEALFHICCTDTSSREMYEVRVRAEADLALSLFHLSAGNVRPAERLLAKGSEKLLVMNARRDLLLDALLSLVKYQHSEIIDKKLHFWLRTALRGNNPSLKSTAIRILIDMRRLNSGMTEAMARQVERVRLFFASYQIPRERRKCAVLLALFYHEKGLNQISLRYAIEARPYLQGACGLCLDRDETLLEILGSPLSLEEKELAASGVPFRSLAGKLLELDPSRDIFPEEFLNMVCRVYGAQKGCLIWEGHNGSPRLLCGLGMSIFDLDRRETASLPGGSQAEGFPCGFLLENSEGHAAFEIKIPIPFPDSGLLLLYLKGTSWEFSRQDLSETELEKVAELFGTIFARHFHQHSTAGLHVRKEKENKQIIYVSKKMGDFLHTVDLVAKTDATVLLYGETGSGKELLASRIHKMSGRKGNLVAVNLSSIPEELFESEMQGYERGAFTGASGRKIGLLELADEGTLFIDELPDIGPRIQVKLLRLLQERSFTRLGGTALIHSNFRIVAATNRNLRRLVQEGLFRDDLYYRLCVAEMQIPPLRERREDIAVLVQYYLDVFSRKYRISLQAPTPKEMAQLSDYGWPGNVRELKNLMEKAVILAMESGHPAFHLPIQEIVAQRSDSTPISPIQSTMPSLGDMLQTVFDGFPTVDDFTSRYIQAVLRLTGGKIDGKNGAASILGLNRSTLYAKMKRKDGQSRN